MLVTYDGLVSNIVELRGFETRRSVVFSLIVCLVRFFLITTTPTATTAMTNSKQRMIVTIAIVIPIVRETFDIIFAGEVDEPLVVDGVGTIVGVV